MKEPQEFLQCLKGICTDLSVYANDEVLPERDLKYLKSRTRSLEEALDKEREEHRILRIGIIGSVKAGKSTFLNALLFHGEDILPQAATPMTASLTRLCYADRPRAQFIFYTREDWDFIVHEAESAEKRIDEEFEKKKKEYSDMIRRGDGSFIPAPDRKKVESALNLPSESSACLELVRNVKQSHLDLDKYLGKDSTVDIEDFHQLREILKEHIGSAGKLSPVVKYVVLEINDETLRDIEIIDTPGLNDPVRSRSQETYKFMDLCDAVFILSRASQFLTEEDINLIKKILHRRGIIHNVVVATKMDLAALDHAGKMQSYKEAIEASMWRIKKSVDAREIEHWTCVSAYMYIYAYKLKNNIPLNDEEEKLRNNIKNFYRDIPVTEKDFKKFSNMASIKPHLERWREHKEQIILEHQQERIKKAHDEILEKLNDFIAGVEKNKHLLVENDIDSLKKKKAQIQQAIDAVSTQLRGLFLEMRNEVRTGLAILGQRIVANASNYDELHVDKKKETKTSTKTTGIIFKDTTVTTKTTTTYSANLSEAIQLLREFSAKIEEDINDTFKNELVNKGSIEKRIRETIAPKITEQGISDDDIGGEIRRLMDDLTVPKVKFENTPYNEALDNEFPDGVIENEKVEKFKVAFEKQTQQMIKDRRGELEQKGEEISDRLLRLSSEFPDALKARVDERIKRIQEQMSRREEILPRYDEAKERLRQAYDMMAR